MYIVVCKRYRTNYRKTEKVLIYIKNLSYYYYFSQINLEKGDYPSWKTERLFVFVTHMHISEGEKVNTPVNIL